MRGRKGLRLGTQRSYPPKYETDTRAWGHTGLGFGAEGLGFRVWGLGFGVWGLGFGVEGLGCRVQQYAAHLVERISTTLTDFCDRDD